MPIANTNSYLEISFDVIQIGTAKGDKFLIDKADLEIAKKHCWSRQTTGYARAVTRQGKKLKTIYLHRLLCETTKKFPHVDHINGNISDNRRANLRCCNRNQNLANQKRRADNRTGVKGVGLHMSGKFRARVRVKGITYQSLHSSLEQASDWATHQRKLLHNEFARNL